MCPGTYIPIDELNAYTQKALDEHLLDQQIRDIDIGKANFGIGMVYRGKLDKPAKDSVAEHDEISEVWAADRLDGSEHARQKVLRRIAEAM